MQALSQARAPSLRQQGRGGQDADAILKRGRYLRVTTNSVTVLANALALANGCVSFCLTVGD